MRCPSCGANDFQRHLDIDGRRVIARCTYCGTQQHETAAPMPTNPQMHHSKSYLEKQYRALEKVVAGSFSGGGAGSNGYGAAGHVYSTGSGAANTSRFSSLTVAPISKICLTRSCQHNVGDIMIVYD